MCLTSEQPPQLGSVLCPHEPLHLPRRRQLLLHLLGENGGGVG